MILQWFNAREASQAGAALADKLTPAAARMEKSDVARDRFREIVQGIRGEVRDLKLNLYQRAKLANAFKWKLIENGIETAVASEFTQCLVMDLSLNGRSEVTPSAPSLPGKPADPAAELFSKANRLAAKRDYASAIDLYEQVLAAQPDHAGALNNMGSALIDEGRYLEGEQYYRRCLSIDPGFVEAHRNLGEVLRIRGFFADSEVSLRRAIKLKPNDLDAHSSLGMTLIYRGRIHQAKGRFAKVLKSTPRHVGALHGMGEIALHEGRWPDADKQFARILELDSKNAHALAARAKVRKMTRDDAAWLEAAEALAAGKLNPPQEAALHYAIGKYFDDIGDFERAFPSFRRANEVVKKLAEPYDRKARVRMVRDLMRAPNRTVLGHAAGASDSTTPVFVVGMPRSGTSLVEQIIASHPHARGAGEVDFWPDAMSKYEKQILSDSLDERTREELAESYLKRLEEHAGDGDKNRLGSVSRIVDKQLFNSDYLGVLLSVFPKAHIIYMRRDPIDTCLSCYFQGFPPTLSFALDLADLAHYYHEHRRIVAHWLDVLPPGAILEVPYEGLVSDPEGWSRKIFGFIGLEWHAGCLGFHNTQRVVTTASYRQVREKIFSTSVARWRNYEKFLGPLLRLRAD